MTLDQLPEPRGTTIRIYLADGVPGGITVVEKDNWNGVGIDCARRDLARARKRQELARSGVYLLVGNETQPGGLPTIYVGEADELASRLPSHGSGKEFWSRAIAFTSKDGSINKAHARYLEARLWALAKRAKRCELDNRVPPSVVNLNDPDRDAAERFLAEILVILPTLGITAFQIPEASRSAGGPILELSGPEAAATGKETTGGFVVFSGSTARASEVASIHPWLSELRKDLQDNGVLVPAGESLRLTQDYVFASPSAAAGVLLGRAANGRTEWRHGTRTLKELQEEQLEASVELES